MNMRKLLLVSLCFLTLSLTQVFAQNRTITGTVTDKGDGKPIPGVTVKIKGANTGVATNGEGKFTLSVPHGAVLQFSFVGYLPVEQLATADMSVALSMESNQLTEVVVTSLGIKAEKKTLGYSQTTVKNSTLNASSPIDLLGGIQGKVAGVTIQEQGSNPGGSTNVVIRGYSSLGQGNQPLYVIDGVPLDNTRPTQNNDYDFGNNANDVDPNDVDNLSILKGAEATALYGTRGSSGVILITTKKGKAGKPRVDFSTSTTMDNAAITWKPQDEFGQGWNGVFYLTENGDWGPKYDGKMHPWGATNTYGATSIGSEQLIKPFVYLPNNVEDAFDTGLELNNHIGISGGTDVMNYNLSYTNDYSNGILPGPYDLFKKNTFMTSVTSKYKNLEISANLNYSARTGNVPVTGQGNTTSEGYSFYNAVTQIPSDIPIRDLANYNNVFFNVDNYFTPYAENPYWDLANNGGTYTTNHIFGNLNLTYRLADWVKLNFQQGADVSATYDKHWGNVRTQDPGSWDSGNNVEGAGSTNDVGGDVEQSLNTFQYDSKLQIMIDKKISNNFSLNAIVGSEYNDRGDRELSTGVTNLLLPGFYQINNSISPPTSSQATGHQRILSFYAQATLGYKDYLYLNITGRNDNTSTLSPDNNSYFYPSANISFLLSQVLGLSPTSFLSYAKLRAAYGETGSDTGPYQTLNTLTSTVIPYGFGSLQFPLAGVGGYTINNVLANPNLQPESITESEFGGEFRFLNDRISLDAAYYDRIRKKQILAVPIPPSSGYEFEEENFGSVENKGIEIDLGGTPVKTKDVTWDISYNFYADRSKVISLPAGLQQVILGSENYTVAEVDLVAIKGQPLGTFLAPQAQTENGHIVVGSTGLPNTDPEPKNYGSQQVQFNMGLTNNIHVKNFDLGFTIDYQQGGKFYSSTANGLNFSGIDPRTVYNDRNAFIIPGSVQVGSINTTTGAVKYVENTTPITHGDYYEYYGIGYNPQVWNNLILTKTFIKLREATLGYTFPKAIAAKIGASYAKLSVFGRNLYTWLPASNHVIDPEVSNAGGDLAGTIGETLTGPPLRYYGAKLNVSF